jgi:hypothetical protein
MGARLASLSTLAQFAPWYPCDCLRCILSPYPRERSHCQAGLPEAHVASLQTIQDPQQRIDKAFTLMEQQSQERLPEVEKLPVHFYTDGITSLENALRLRQIVAFEHWQGNTACTLGEVIQKVG